MTKIKTKFECEVCILFNEMHNCCMDNWVAIDEIIRCPLEAEDGCN